MRYLDKSLYYVLTLVIAVLIFSGCGSGGSSSSTGGTGIGIASLSWNPDTSPVAGYKVYYGTASRSYGTPIDVGNVTNYAVTGLGKGTYYFAVTAYNSSGLESVFSNEVSKIF